MIVAFELQYSEWQHEEVNSGVLRMLANVEKNVVFCAAKGQIESVREIGIPASIRCEAVELLHHGVSGLEESVPFYYKLIETMCNKLELTSNDMVVLTSSPTAAMYAFERLIGERKVLSKCIFIQHSNIEKIKKTDAFSDYVILDKLTNYDNVYFASYNPYTAEWISEMINSRVGEKFLFLHHPVDFVGDIATAGGCSRVDIEVSDENYEVVVFGACINKNFKRLLRKMVNENTLVKNLFLVLQRVDLDFLETKYQFPDVDIKVIKGINGFSREERIAYLKRIKWILIPYDYDMYAVTMSGILADAIRYEIPIIAMNSKIIQYYNNIKTIGILAEDINSLDEKVLSLKNIDDETYRNLKKNMANLKEYMENENVNLCRRIMEL